MEGFRAALARVALPRNGSNTGYPGRATVDYRQNVPPVLTNVKDQGLCGCCWSFGTTEAIETHSALQFGRLSVLSMQQLVSCAPMVNATWAGHGTIAMGECNGYFPNAAIDYLTGQGGGQTSEWRNPFTSYYTEAPNPVAKCVRHPASGGLSNHIAFANVTGYKQLPTNDEDAFQTTLSESGPIVLVMYTPDALASYEAGVFADPHCINYPAMMPSHVVLLVGYGHDAELKKDYWIIRNSWNTFWGEDGYLRLLRDSPSTCGRMVLPTEFDEASKSYIFNNVTSCGTCGILGYGFVPVVAPV